MLVIGLSPDSETWCSKITPWGRCRQQSSTASDLCIAHLAWSLRDREPDRYYEEKVARGLLVPTWDYLTTAEAHAVLNGRYRGDGRRIDQYITDDPLYIDEEHI